MGQLSLLAEALVSWSVGVMVQADSNNTRIQVACKRATANLGRECFINVGYVLTRYQLAFNRAPVWGLDSVLVGGKAPGAIVADTKKNTMLGRFLLPDGLLGFGRHVAKTIALL